MKDKALRLLQMYGSLARSESKILMGMAIRINEASRDAKHVRMLNLISFMIRYASRDERQSVLEINHFDERLQKLDSILSREIDRIKDLVKRAETYKDAEGPRGDLLRSLINKGLTRRGSPVGQGMRGNDDAGSEVEQLAKKFDELQMPEETKTIVQKELKKVSQLDPRNQEYHVSLNYLNTIASLPWGVF